MEVDLYRMLSGSFFVVLGCLSIIGIIIFMRLALRAIKALDIYIRDNRRS